MSKIKEERSEINMAILNTIISETFTRHNDLTEEEFLKEIEVEGLTEEIAVKNGFYNILLDTTKVMFDIKFKVGLLIETLKTLKKEHEKVEEELKNE